MEVGISYALGFSVLIIVTIAALTLVLFFRTEGRDSTDSAIMGLAMAIDAGVLVFIYLRIKRNDEKRRAILEAKKASLKVTDCPDYYERVGDNCMSHFKDPKDPEAPAKAIGIGAVETVKLAGDDSVNTKTRDNQCATTTFAREPGTPAEQPRVWTHLRNACGAPT